MLHLIDWFEQLLFGNSGCPLPPPMELKSLILRLEADSIPWSHILFQGGLTAFPYQVHGDLNSLIDYLEKQWLDKLPHYEPYPFKTRAVSKFWDQLQLLLARRNAEPLPPVPSQQDDDILKDMLDDKNEQSEDYQSAKFWGQVARRFVNLRRPEPSVSILPASDENLKRAMQLYDMTCKARGHYFDPFNMHLVHHSEYVNAAHWQTDQNLEAFMHDRPSHPLTLSVQALLKRTTHDLLNGDKPTTLQDPGLDALLHNIRVIHQSVQQVPHGPPKLIDIFQRLLALCHRDGLWEREVPPIHPVPSLTGLSLLHLTEQLRMAERERRILLKDVTVRTGESDSMQRGHTC